MSAPERMTAVFECDLRKMKGNPFHQDTPFGRPVAVGIGDAFAEIDDLTPCAAAPVHHAPRVKPDIHEIAGEIFKAIVWGAQQPPPPYGAAYPSYTRQGNSDAETEARAAAARILSALEPAQDSAFAQEGE